MASLHLGINLRAVVQSMFGALDYACAGGAEGPLQEPGRYGVLHRDYPNTTSHRRVETLAGSPQHPGYRGPQHRRESGTFPGGSLPLISCSVPMLFVAVRSVGKGKRFPQRSNSDVQGKRSFPVGMKGVLIKPPLSILGDCSLNFLRPDREPRLQPGVRSPPPQGTDCVHQEAPEARRWERGGDLGRQPRALLRHGSGGSLPAQVTSIILVSVHVGVFSCASRGNA